MQIGPRVMKEIRNKADLNLGGLLSGRGPDKRQAGASPFSPAPVLPRGPPSPADWAREEHSNGRVVPIDKGELDPWTREAPRGSSF